MGQLVDSSIEDSHRAYTKRVSCKARKRRKAASMRYFKCAGDTGSLCPRQSSAGEVYEKVGWRMVDVDVHSVPAHDVLVCFGMLFCIMLTGV
eukprot:241440-Rhodomonas_salina.1